MQQRHCSRVVSGSTNFGQTILLQLKAFICSRQLTSLISEILLGMKNSICICRDCVWKAIGGNRACGQFVWHLAQSPPPRFLGAVKKTKLYAKSMTWLSTLLLSLFLASIFVVGVFEVHFAYFWSNNGFYVLHQFNLWLRR